MVSFQFQQYIFVKFTPFVFGVFIHRVSLLSLTLIVTLFYSHCFFLRICVSHSHIWNKHMFANESSHASYTSKFNNLSSELLLQPQNTLKKILRSFTFPMQMNAREKYDEEETESHLSSKWHKCHFKNSNVCLQIISDRRCRKNHSQNVKIWRKNMIKILSLKVI